MYIQIIETLAPCTILDGRGVQGTPSHSAVIYPFYFQPHYWGLYTYTVLC